MKKLIDCFFFFNLQVCFIFYIMYINITIIIMVVRFIIIIGWGLFTVCSLFSQQVLSTSTQTYSPILSYHFFGGQWRCRLEWKFWKFLYCKFKGGINRNLQDPQEGCRRLLEEDVLAPSPRCRWQRNCSCTDVFGLCSEGWWFRRGLFRFPLPRYFRYRRISGLTLILRIRWKVWKERMKQFVIR